MTDQHIMIEDLIEPLHAENDAQPDSFANRSRYLPPYVRVKARRRAPPKGEETRRIIV